MKDEIPKLYETEDIPAEKKSSVPHSKIFRYTITKYLRELTKEKKLETRRIGKYVLYRRARYELIWKN